MAMRSGSLRNRKEFGCGLYLNQLTNSTVPRKGRITRKRQIWCRGPESNWLRPPFQGGALPVSYPGTVELVNFRGPAMECQFKAATTLPIDPTSPRAEGARRSLRMQSPALGID